jgi:hypothetical protein
VVCFQAWPQHSRGRMNYTVKVGPAGVPQATVWQPYSCSTQTPPLWDFADHTFTFMNARACMHARTHVCMRTCERGWGRSKHMSFTWGTRLHKHRTTPVGSIRHMPRSYLDVEHIGLDRRVFVCTWWLLHVCEYLDV